MAAPLRNAATFTPEAEVAGENIPRQFVAETLVMTLAWSRGDDMEPVTELRLDIMSKTDILRTIVAEKLTTAAQEILAVVERTMAGYEQEASVFREEIDRQRRQMELLQMPEIKTEPVDAEQLFPVSEPERDGGENYDEAQQQTYELEDGSTCVLMSTEGHAEELASLPMLPPPDDPAPHTELHYKRASISSTRRVRSKKSRIRKYPTVQRLSPIPLKIRLLEDPGIDLVTKEVYKKYPEKRVMCQAHLQEEDFLDLLRSVFPQLTADRTFDLFLCNRKGSLFPLRVKSLTPVMVYKKIKGRSALFLRLKNQETLHSQPQSKDVAAGLPSDLDKTRPLSHIDFNICILKDPSNKLNKNYPVHKFQCPRHLQETDFLDLLRSTFPALAAGKTLEIFTSDKTKKLLPLSVTTVTPEEIHRVMAAKRHVCLYVLPKPLEELQNSVKDLPSDVDPALPKKRDQSVRSSRGRPRNTPDCLELKIWILENSKTNHVSTKLFQNITGQKLQCPFGLQETDFLDLLRSTFPQLAHERSFDFFVSDRTKKLFPLKARTLTPEDIQSSIRSFGSGHSALYIRLKAVDRLNTREEGLPSTTDQTSLTPRVDGPQNSDGKSHIVLNVCFLQAQINLVSNLVLTTNPVHEVLCPRGLTELDFLKLLRSTFPQLAAGKPFDILTTDQTGRLHPLRVKITTPEEIQKVLESSPNSNIFIQLRGPHAALTSVEKLLPKGDVNAAKDSPSTSDQTVLNSSHVEAAGSRAGKKGVKDSSGLWWTEPLLLSESEKEDGEDNEVTNGDDWTPDRSEDQNLKDTKMNTGRRSVRSGVQVKKQQIQRSDPGTVTLSCSVCRVPRTSLSLLIKHCWSHVEDPAKLCGVCGKCSESAEELRSHLQSHLKTHNCNICGKSFLSLTGLKGHIARHKGERPHQCTICHKAFAESWVLNNHMTTHSPDKPHKCDICQKACVSIVKLKLHRATHTDERPFQCSMCSNSYRSLGTLSQHMLRHLGRSGARARSHACHVCGETFNTGWKLQVHVRSHGLEQEVSKRSRKFSAKSRLLSVT